MTTCDDVLMACSMAARLTLEAAAKAAVNHRGRAARSRYDGIPGDTLYLALDPPVSAAEMDRFEERFTRWWGLPSVLDESAIPHTRLYMQALAQYVRDCTLTQRPHNVAALRAYLAQVDAVAAG